MLVPDGIRGTVFFIGVKKGDVFQPRATGFFAGIVDGAGGFQHGFTYMVTAEHVISGLVSAGETIWLRFNLNNGGVGYRSCSLDLWYFHPDDESRTDVAVCPVDQWIFANVPIVAIGLNGPIVNQPVIEHLGIGVGDEVCIAGLFRSHSGQGKNVPIVRVGHIAAMKGEPVWTRYCGYLDAYLIEAMSIAGLSGSPVFVHLPPIRIVDGEARTTTGHRMYLLGLIHGHFDIQNLNEDVVTQDAGGSLQGIHTGIGVVVPVEKIIETVNQEAISVRRKKWLEDQRQSGAIGDLAGDPSPPANDENPTHREDFMRLVSAAARKPVQED